MKNFDLLEDMKMLQVNCIMIYIIHKISKLFQRFFKEYKTFDFFKNLINFFSQHITMKSSSLEKDKK